jgi:hypothetical protein
MNYKKILPLFILPTLLTSGISLTIAITQCSKPRAYPFKCYGGDIKVTNNTGANESILYPHFTNDDPANYSYQYDITKYSDGLDPQ